MILGIGRQLPFRQFEDGVSFVVELQLSGDLSEDSLAVIKKLNLDSGGRPFDYDNHYSAGRVVDRIVEHFSKTVLPNVSSTLRDIGEEGLDLGAPYRVLLDSVGERNRDLFFLKYGECVTAIARGTLGDQKPVRDETVEMPTDSLP